MTRRDFFTARRSAAFGWKIVCRSGALSFGYHTDFLLTLVIAKQQKVGWAAMLPSSTLRVQLLYPNGQRVSRDDIKAALHALRDHRVLAIVSARLSKNCAGIDLGEARGSASTVFKDDSSEDSAKPIFRQAGVVAPPDSPDLGNPVEVASMAVEV
ncbi:hypothetical protein EGT07_07475 [Herbaspirillum sp. HC18]|nr:hypothetical protein EGT07_07475 [Herbaspirillum sp. HC18]